MEKVSPNLKPLNKEDFSSICRLCLMQGPLASIFELKYEESSFSEIIFELFSTQVNSEDELPKNVCETCISQIICFYNFRKVFIASEKTLQAIISKELNSTIHGPIFCDEEIKLEDSIITISSNDLNEDIIEVKKELVIDKTFESNDQELRLEDQIINVKNSNEKNEIRIDSITTTDNTDTTNDFLDNREDSGKLQKDISSTVNVDCQVRHFANGAKKKRKSLKPKIFTCTYCAKTYIDSRSYEVHLKRHANNKSGKSHQCQICQKRFTTKAALEAHLWIHVEKKFLCSYCGKKFHTSVTLQTHLRVHTEAKPYSCTVCNRPFSHSATLKTHMLTHTGDKPYQCTICSKVFSLKHNLKAHLRTHSGEKPYTCPYCKKAFSDNRNLGVHIRIHTGEPPHMCDLCPRGFYDSTSLKRHRKLHLEELKNEKKRD